MDEISNGFKLLAILGATAWLLPLIELIRYLFRKPNLIVIPHNELEVGFTWLGPILNVRLAFLAENKKALINKITITLTHQKRETNDFLWYWFEEELLQMDIPGTGSFPYKKHQKAIAINIPLDELIEKKIGFQQKSFKDQYDNAFGKLNERYIDILDSNTVIQTLRTDREYNAFIDLFKNEFNWKVGDYKMVIEIFILKRRKPFTHEMGFHLTSLDIKSLAQNIDLCKKFTEKRFLDKDMKIEKQLEWIFPYIQV